MFFYVKKLKNAKKSSRTVFGSPRNIAKPIRDPILGPGTHPPGHVTYLYMFVFAIFHDVLPKKNSGNTPKKTPKTRIFGRYVNMKKWNHDRESARIATKHAYIDVGQDWGRTMCTCVILRFFSGVFARCHGFSPKENQKNNDFHAFFTVFCR